jgi:shikimate kinase
MNTIYLTGFMGSGKTTVGKELGDCLGLPVIDTDHYIEEKSGRSISSMFEKEGEAYFREQEHKALMEASGDDVIVTTGGGIVTGEANRQWMKETGFIIYLHCDLDEIQARLQEDDTRPLFKGKPLQSIQQLYDKRQPLYKDCHLIVNTSGKEVSKIADEIAEWLKGNKIGDTNEQNL